MFKQEFQNQELNFDDIKSIKGLVILEFGAPWCPHCQVIQEPLCELLNGSAPMTHIKIYDGKGKRLGRLFKVKLWPTLILLKEGEELDRLVRPDSRAQLERFIG
ncbi:thioredoxin family protein [Marinomonas epiphytica]